MFYFTIKTLYPAHFGAWDNGPQHGFARISNWTCTQLPIKVKKMIFIMQCSFLF